MVTTYDDLRTEWLSPADHIIAHTSGSTGMPKQIRLPKEMVRASALRTCRFFGIDSSSRLHSCISPEFIGGKMQMIRALETGCAFTSETPSNQPLQDLRGEHIDMVSVVPSQLNYILDHSDAMPMVRVWLVGGSPLTASMRRRVAASGLNVWESYGMTETASHIALRKVTAEETPFSPLPGITVSSDPRGCLVIDHGFGTVVTNDLVSIHPDGSFSVLGRIDHVIISGGRKINPYEIERMLAPLPGGHDFIVTSVPDDKWVNALALKVETGGAEIDLDALLRHIALISPSWKRPKHILTVEKLPRTPNGKVIRS